MASFSVIEFLSESHGIEARAGKKGPCPFCNGPHFSITKDDALGKCFSPSCGLYINQANSCPTQKQSLFKIHESILQDFHECLIKQEGKKSGTAWSYLVDERKIHPSVVKASLLGAIPRNYNLDEKFDPIIAEIESELHKIIGTDKTAESKKKVLSHQVERLKDAKEKFKRVLVGKRLSPRHGAITFAYCDEFHRVVAIKFREPFTKEITLYKPTQVMGLFGHQLFEPYEDERHKQLNKHLIVVEGEFNQLQFQSCLARASEVLGKQFSYAFVAAVGGVNSADTETLKKICRTPYIAYDNDLNRAGEVLVEKAQEKMSIYAFTTPEPDSDLDSFIVKSGDDMATIEKIKSLIQNSRFCPRNVERVAEEVFLSRQKQGSSDKRKDFEINSNAFELLIADLKDRGELLYDGQLAYLFSKTDKNLVKIDAEDQDYKILMSRYKINASEIIYKYIYSELETTAAKTARRVTVYPFSHYDDKTNRIYLSNFSNQVYRISQDQIELCENGVDGVLFLPNKVYDKFIFEKPSWRGSLWDEKILSQVKFSNKGLHPSEAKTLFLIWILTLFFPELFPTKVILAFIGVKGSGKTSAARRVLQIIHGVKSNVTPIPKEASDFDAIVTNNSLIVLDNADTKNPWLDDRLAIAATGGTTKKRKLYTTNEFMEATIQCHLMITARDPHFRRDDVADRVLPLKVERQNKFKGENRLIREISENRDRLMSELIEFAQEGLIALAQAKDEDDIGSFRMADFSSFATKLGRHAGIGNKIEEIFKKISAEQSQFALEDNSLFIFLYRWVQKNPNNRVTNVQLCEALSEFAKTTGQKFEFSGRGPAFAQRMSHLRPNLKEFFDITESNGGQRNVFYHFKIKKEMSDV
ncbi:toprim domain-containing protein [Bdellovibrio sp. KM01]|uniref:toprim domain-containing protein n=1 Tax=Bdellovibrio sp. KM01 TaxID=2748865 RepID=UPI0015E943F7|nr:toprim domain-containing protein [Bdellovibrio sp. KM01]QLY25690.1 toprim domain-containing protein [Bdellovibrio sp. KM01]